jgi:hypothetical protein
VTPVGLADGVIVQASLPIPEELARRVFVARSCALRHHQPLDLQVMMLLLIPFRRRVRDLGQANAEIKLEAL